MLAVHPADVRERLMELPWVADAAVKRIFPDTVAITVIEKLPFALWKNGKHISVVERSGHLITQADPARFNQLAAAGRRGRPRMLPPRCSTPSATPAPCPPASRSPSGCPAAAGT